MRADLVRRIRRVTTYMDKSIGQKAIYRVRTQGDVDVTTGVVAQTVANTNVEVRSRPLSVRERSDLTQAGLGQVDAAWFMQTTYRSGDVQAGHFLEVPVGGFEYEVLSATKDELDIEWTIYTRRLR